MESIHLSAGLRGRNAARLTLLAAALAHAHAHAADFKMGEGTLSVDGAVNYGLMQRTGEPNWNLVNVSNAAAVGHVGLNAAARNQDDANLNFGKGDLISNVLKGMFTARAQSGNFTGVVSAKAWNDFALSEHDVPWGNTPNGYAPAQPLGDNGARARSKFSGAVLMEAFGDAKFAVGGMPASVRIGNQVISWGDRPQNIGGERTAIPGGLSAITPVDIPALQRPGALAEEVKIPVPAVVGRLGLTPAVQLEGFYQVRFERSELPECGTFFSISDFLAPGCDKVYVGAGTDRTLLAAGSFVARAPTPSPSNSGEFGLAATYRTEDRNTEIGVYLAQYHSRFDNASAIKSTRVGPPFVPGNADGRSVAYFTEFAERVRMAGLTFGAKRDDLWFGGELTYRPNQPLQLNSSDLLNAVSSATAPTLLRSDINAVAPGGVFHGYDRYGVSQLNLGISKFWAGPLLGANGFLIGADAGFKHVHNLPSPAVRRYGRADTFGAGPVNGVCAPGASAVQCSSDGYVSSNSYGHRLRMGLRYVNAMTEGLALVPAVVFAHDVKGWSYDGVFNEGRKSASLSVRAEYQARYTAEINWTRMWGGIYNSQSDRSFASLSIGMKF